MSAAELCNLRSCPVYGAVLVLFTDKRRTRTYTDLVACIWMTHQYFQALKGLLFSSFIGETLMKGNEGPIIGFVPRFRAKVTGNSTVIISKQNYLDFFGCW